MKAAFVESGFFVFTPSPMHQATMIDAMA